MAKNVKNIGPIDLAYSVLGAGKTVCGVADKGLGYVENLVSSAVSGSELEQAKNRIIEWYQAVKDISLATGLTMDEAAEVLTKELNK